MSKRKDGTVIGRPKGGKNRKFTPEQKIDFVLKCIKENSPIDTFAKLFYLLVLFFTHIF